MAEAIQAIVNPRIRDFSDVLRLDARDMGVLRDRIDARFRRLEKALFASEGASGGSKWPALSKRYERSKAKKYPGRKIMARTGRLRRSLTESGSSEHVARYGLGASPYVEVGTTDVVAAYHAPPVRGAAVLKNPRLPDRDTLQMTVSQGLELTAIVRDYLVRVKLPRVFGVLRAAMSVAGPRGLPPAL